ncbi:uncharacterized protein V6R79_004431, partial [Siganus canaliculatus]
MSRVSTPEGPLDLWKELETWLQVMTDDLLPGLSDELKNKSRTELEDNLTELMANAPKVGQGNKDLAKIFGALAHTFLAHTKLTEDQLNLNEHTITALTTQGKDRDRALKNAEEDLALAECRVVVLEKEIEVQKVERREEEEARTEVINLKAALRDLKAATAQHEKDWKQTRDEISGRLGQAEDLLQQAEDQLKDRKLHILALEKHLREARHHAEGLDKELLSTKEQLQQLQAIHDRDKKKLVETQKELDVSYQIGKSPSLHQPAPDKTNLTTLQSQEEDVKTEPVDDK